MKNAHGAMQIGWKIFFGLLAGATTGLLISTVWFTFDSEKNPDSGITALFTLYFLVVVGGISILLFVIYMLLKRSQLLLKIYTGVIAAAVIAFGIFMAVDTIEYNKVRHLMTYDYAVTQIEECNVATVFQVEDVVKIATKDGTVNDVIDAASVSKLPQLFKDTDCP